MKDNIKKLMARLGKKEFLLLLTFTFFAYVLVERAGPFRLEPASYREIFHSMAVRFLSVLIALNSLAGLVPLLKERERRGKAGAALFLTAIMVLTASIWVSIYTRFEGKAIRTEGQTFNAFKEDYVQETLYMRGKRMLPQVGITILNIHPEGTTDMKGMKEVKADILYAGRTTGGVRNGRLSSRWPLISDWTMVRITDFGYAPRYVLYDLKEQELESMYMYMSLFPPGREAHFETMFLGYLFYLKCYPDFAEKNKVFSTTSLYPGRPAFNMRIVRNKDIVYNGLIRPGEKLRFDNFIISVPDVKMWVEMSFVRDLGLPVAAFGIALLLPSVGMMFFRKRDS